VRFLNRRWLAIAAIGALWLIVINQLRFEWSINPQYAYGWLVPCLSLYLFAERWKRRPAPGPARAPLLLAATAVMLTLALLPLRLVQEANPDWRLISWAMALMLIGLTLCALYQTGGLPWIAHFAFPVLFILVAVPWPVPLETRLVQGLMRVNAALAVEGLAWCALPAVQLGNVIQIGATQVGVEEACSGVRSLQTTLMISLFLGELYRFGALRRLFLVVLGFVIAFACNVGRTFLLVYLAGAHGTTSLERWHDLAGLGVLAGIVGGLFVAARLLRQGSAAVAASASTVEPARLIPAPALIALLAWCLIAEVFTEGWYRMHERVAARNPGWTVEWPKASPHFRPREISEASRAILKYTEGDAASWAAPDGSSWMGFFLRWSPGRTAAQLASAHGPGVCLPATGIKLQSDLGVGNLRLNGIDLPFHAYVFEYDGRPLHVFYCLWEDRARDGGAPKIGNALTYGVRLKSVMNGVRNTGQQVLEIAVLGYDDATQARAALIRQLGHIIRS
jgi:exosortase